MAHLKARKFNYKGWDLLTDAETDPDSNCITKQDKGRHWLQQRRRRCVVEAGIPLTEGLGSSRPTALTALQRKREEEVQAKPCAQASAAVSQPSRIRFKDIEVSRGCDLLHGQVQLPREEGSCLPVIVLLNTVWAEVDEASVAERHQNHQNPGDGGSCARGIMCSCPSLLLNIKLC